LLLDTNAEKQKPRKKKETAIKGINRRRVRGTKYMEKGGKGFLTLGRGRTER